jgi:hypothetical protein
MKKALIAFCLVLLFTPGFSQQITPGFRIVEQKEQKQVVILWNDKLLTAYCYYDSIRKPILFPLMTTDGITVTRGYPIKPVAGERTDHPHHTGMWLNYESVNGLDFWNNSTAIAPERRHLYGTIRHEKILSQKAGRNKATLVVSANWQRPDGYTLLRETTTFDFQVKEGQVLIDRTTTLTANGEKVVFKDVKDGFLAIRVARELEQPSQQADVFVDAHGNQTTVPKVDNKGVSGLYYSSEGLKGDSVWSSKGRWVMLKGEKQGRKIAIGILDHPSNPGYPSYWHARGYGLFAVNPLGRKIFSNGREELNLLLQPKESVTFRYRVVIASGREVTDEKMNELADAFAGK